LPRAALQNDDASLYALAAKNAVIHNQWLAQFVTPGDRSSFLDKPPLGIWLLAWPMKLFGVSELTVHIPNAIYFALLLFVQYLMLIRISSKKIAFYSTIISATSLGLVVYSRAPKLDILLPFFVMIAHFSLYTFLKKDDPSYLFLFTLSLVCAFLVKSGFGLLLPVLTVLFLLIFNANARTKILKAVFSRHSLINGLLFFAIVVGILGLQFIPLQDQWLPYLKAITIQSKYNTSYLGFGFYYSIIGFLLIILFPWSPLWLSTIKFPKLRKNTPHLSVGYSKLTLSDFCTLWFWSNVLFLLFFYRQNDLRTFTVFVPPMAILAGLRLIAINWKPETKRLGFQGMRKPRRSVAGFLWSLFFLVIFSIILITVILNPINPQGFSLKAAILPFALFTFSLIPLTLYLWKPNQTKFVITFALVCLSYSVLFYNTKPIADAFNPDVTWPGIIKEQRNKGVKFYIYRPPDRQLFYSPDLFYVDFMAGPADRYYWRGNELIKAVARGNALILSDTKSLNKLKLTRLGTLAQDNYSSLVITQ